MKEIRRLALHLLLLVVAGAWAYVKAQPEDEASRPLEPGEVQMWGGSHKDLKSLTWTSKTKIVRLERQ